MTSKFQDELIKAINAYNTSFSCLQDTGAKENLDNVIRRACDMKALELCNINAYRYGDLPPKIGYWIELSEAKEGAE